MASDRQPAFPNQPNYWKSKILPVLAILVSLLSGGAMGAWINHYYATRQSVVSYSIDATSLGATEATKSALPNLRLELDKVEIPAVYTHTVTLRHASGPELDQASISIALQNGKLLGNPLPFGPDPVHLISCKASEGSQIILCSVGRISPGYSPYKIILATDGPSKITLAIDGKNARIEQSSNAQPETSGALWTAIALILSVMLVVYTVLSAFFRRREEVRLRETLAAEMYRSDKIFADIKEKLERSP